MSLVLGAAVSVLLKTTAPGWRIAFRVYRGTSLKRNTHIRSPTFLKKRFIAPDAPSAVSIDLPGTHSDRR